MDSKSLRENSAQKLMQAGAHTRAHTGVLSLCPRTSLAPFPAFSLKLLRSTGEGLGCFSTPLCLQEVDEFPVSGFFGGGAAPKDTQITASVTTA